MILTSVPQGSVFGPIQIGPIIKKTSNTKSEQLISQITASFLNTCLLFYLFKLILFSIQRSTQFWKLCRRTYNSCKRKKTKIRKKKRKKMAVTRKRRSLTKRAPDTEHVTLHYLTYIKYSIIVELMYLLSTPNWEFRYIKRNFQLSNIHVTIWWNM